MININKMSPPTSAQQMSRANCQADTRLARQKVEYHTEYLKCFDKGCSRIFSKRKRLDDHMNGEHQVVPYRCPLAQCDGKFTDRESFKVHYLKAHRTTRIWTCRKCHAEYDDCKALSQHFDFDHQPGSYTCGQGGCSYSSLYRGDVLVHYNRQHRNEAAESSRYRVLLVNCTDCQGTFAKTADLEEHLGRKHGVKAYRCLVKGCKRSYNTRDDHREHSQWSHRDLTEWQCSWCNQSFTSHDQLTWHVLLGHESGSFACVQCQFKGQLRADVLSHFGREHGAKAKMDSNQLGLTDHKPTDLSTIEKRIAILRSQINTSLLRQSWKAVREATPLPSSASKQCPGEEAKHRCTSSTSTSTSSSSSSGYQTTDTDSVPSVKRMRLTPKAPSSTDSTFQMATCAASSSAPTTESDSESDVSKRNSFSSPTPPSRSNSTTTTTSSRGSDAEPKLKFLIKHLDCLVADCSKTFGTRRQLDLHMMIEHGVYAYRCPMKGCSERFKFRYALTEHLMEEHRHSDRWQCHKCHHQFGNPHTLQQHYVFCHQSGRFLCAYSGCTFRSSFRDQAWQHFKRIHQNSDNNSDTDEKVADRASDVKVDDVKVKADPDSVDSRYTVVAIKCTHCSEWFMSQQLMESHRSYHHRIQRFPCPAKGCDSSSNTSFDLRAHCRARHHDIKQWRCRECSRYFSSATRLVDHLVLAHGEGVFDCAQCSAFKAKYRADVVKHVADEHCGGGGAMK